MVIPSRDVCSDLMTSRGWGQIGGMPTPFLCLARAAPPSHLIDRSRPFVGGGELGSPN